MTKRRWAGLVGIFLLAGYANSHGLSAIPRATRPDNVRRIRVTPPKTGDGHMHAHPVHSHGHRSAQIGIATWYGRDFNGHPTADGERFDMDAMTAAHRTLPLGSYVRVTLVSNARSVVVRINDRGPYVRGRTIDLSYGAARALGIVGSGRARVAIEPVGKDERHHSVGRPHPLVLKTRHREHGRRKGGAGLSGLAGGSRRASRNTPR
jgi:rare lipoprotein A (peptidoglycan hydrolase)